ncbi:MAG: amino acid ABC transporter permease [Desulfobacterium sp.]|jgi:polar amino acid transport system permease protein|nr:amino acid ABC transporter permease [Desulfobacterium sp.]
MVSFFNYAIKILPDMLSGAWVTVQLSVVCITVGIIFGMVLGVLRVYSSKFVYWMVTAYVEFLRGTPCLLQLFFIYYGLGDMGLLLKPILAAGLALGINTSVYQAEYFRGAIQSIKPGQMVAARAMGLGKWQSVRYVILPQALRLVIPSSSNEIIYMFKYTSVAFAVGVPELLAQADLTGSMNYRYFESYVVAAIIYTLMVFFVAKIISIIEKKAYVPGLQLAQ